MTGGGTIKNISSGHVVSFTHFGPSAGIIIPRFVTVTFNDLAFVTYMSSPVFVCQDGIKSGVEIDMQACCCHSHLQEEWTQMQVD